MKTIYKIIILLLFFSLEGYPSKDLFFSHIEVKDGLSHISVYDIFQDSDDYLWFGTRNGLNKYDGYEFETYYKEPQNDHSLSDNDISTIAEDSKKNKWIGTKNGLNRIDYNTGQITHIYPRLSDPTYPSNQINHLLTTPDGHTYGTINSHIFECDENDSIHYIKKLPGEITSIIQAANQDIYLSTYSGGIYIFSHEWLLKKHLQPKDYSLFPLTIVSMLVESNGDLWIGTREEGLYFYSCAAKSFSVLNTQNSSLQSNYVRSLISYDTENTLLGTPEGLYIVDKTNLQLSAIQQKISQEGETDHHSIFCMLIDKNKTIWIGTFTGINYHSLYHKPISLISPHTFTGIINKGQQDKAGNLWFATEGAGLLFYNPHTKEQKLYPIKPKKQENFHTNIIKTILFQNDLILCGTHTGEVLQFNTKSGQYQSLYNFGQNDIYTLYIDCKQRLWIPTNSSDHLVLIENGIKRNTFRANGKEMQFQAISAIKEIEPDLFLFGSLGGSIYLYDYARETLREISPVTKNQDKLGTISTILADTSAIWISTLKNGLFRFDRNFNFKKQYTKEDGLSDCYISSIFIDKQNDLWLATGNELYTLNTKEDKFYSIRPVNILPLAYSVHGSFSTPDEVIYFPGNNGIISINAKQITRNPIVPTVHITSLTTNDNNKIITLPFTNTTEAIHLSAMQNNLTIQYVALNYIHAADNQYTYKMDGVDDAWQNAGEMRTAYYHKLPPGKYLFRLKSSNNDGVWNLGETVLHITIDPPLYKTWWAYLLYILLAFTFICRVIRYQQDKLRLAQEIYFKQKEQERIQELHEERMRMFHNFSHELRTPLTLIINPLEDILQHIPFSQDVLQALLMMKKNTRRMLLLVNNLMDVQKYEAGKFILNKSIFDVTAFIEEVSNNFKKTAEGRGIVFVSDNCLPASFKANYDEKELEKVLFNLLSNAFKYTPSQGKVTLRTRLVQKQEFTPPPSLVVQGKATSYFLYLEVSDTGKGFSKEEGEKIFEPFYSFSSDIHQQLSGTGIGLSLVRSIVTKHEGSIWTESTPKAGARFIVILPYAEPQPEVTACPTTEASETKEKALALLKEGEALHKPTLLLVDDDNELVQYLTQQLKETYLIVTAQNGTEAIGKMNCHPQLIVSDVMMPLTNGISLCKQIKSDPQTAHTPVILLTAQSITSQIEEGLAAGADDYIIKPFEIALLKARIKNLLLKSEKKQAVSIESATINKIEYLTNSKKNDFLIQYIEVVKKNLSNQELDVQLICEALCMSRTNFYRKSKEFTPLSPNEFIKSIRMEVASQLLRETELNVSEVIQQTGYSSRSYFSKSFKEIYSVSPSEYRKKTT